MSGREPLLGWLAMAGRDLSDAAVMFHTVVAEQLGLGASDWKTLGLLERQGPLTAGELSAQSGLAPASVTGILDRLEAGGWVRRRRDPADGRRVVVALDQAVLMSRQGDFFGGLMRRLADLYARYDDRELELLLGFMTEIARRQKEATAELRDAARSAEPA
jgi:DNA-binding transcriptional ArsR family regulator